MKLQWSDSLSVGNPLILSQAFQRLVVGVGIHFVNEEQLARAVELPFDDIRKMNLYLQRELEHMRSELDAKDGIWSEGAVEHFSLSLKNWMAAHIGRDKRLLKPALIPHPYDLKP